MGEWSENAAILCVDDEASVVESVRSQLRQHLGNTVDIEVASSGAEAIELVQELLEDGIDLWLVICDEIMPQMRGHDVLAAVHKLSPKTRTVLLTGQAEMAAVTESVNRANLFHFIAKPWDRMDLLMTADRAIESWKADHDRVRRIETFFKFVPSRFLSVLGVEDPVEATANIGVLRDMSVLFTDIRRFTSLSESKDPSTIFATLNQLFEVVVPLVTNRGGIVDKFIGDAVMALFPEPAEATRAAMEIAQVVRQLDTPLGRLEVGVGIHRGEVTMGTVGTASRIQTTAVGDVVNVAARIEGLTKLLQTSVLLSDCVAEHADIATRYVGRFPIRGRSESVGIHQCLDLCDDAERAAIAAGEIAFLELTKPDGTMLDQSRRAPLAAYTEAHPRDRLAAALHERLNRR